MGGNRFNPDVHWRRSIRLQGYDYASAGMYCITICTQDRLCLFGKIENGVMRLNEAGRMVDKWWHELENKYQNIRLREKIITPNHFHGIIQIINHSPISVNHRPVGADLCVCPEKDYQGYISWRDKAEIKRSPVCAMVQWFKTMVTNEYIRGVKQYGWRRFRNKLWQRNYYEHIIRTEKSYLEIAEYINTNPFKWHEDRYYV